MQTWFEWLKSLIECDVTNFNVTDKTWLKLSLG